MRVPSPYAPSAGIASCSRIMFLLQIVQTIEPNASPSAFKKRLKRITRPQQTGIQTFWELSAFIGRIHLPSGQSIYRNDVIPRTLGLARNVAWSTGDGDCFRAG